MRISYHKSESKFAKCYTVTIKVVKEKQVLQILKSELESTDKVLSERKNKFSFLPNFLEVERVVTKPMCREFFTREQAEAFVRNNK